MTDNLNLTPKQRDGIVTQLDYYIVKRVDYEEVKQWLNENTIGCSHRYISIGTGKCFDCGEEILTPEGK